eukprot:TRINITY_DN36913_c0_g1_i1.p1 TRINITY_DN36913_c0_g1~~TRINITY_DN36913_c0_g1_i1.p1  ORF type:complete len:265 (+),score=27.88 TRINITY_DN36913_c0_g1_i1:52-846(+)
MANVLLFATCFAKLVSLKELSPSMVFGEEGRVVVAGPPGEEEMEVDELNCIGYNCHHRPVVRAECSFDPMHLEESIDLVWTCEETLGEMPKKTPIGYASSIFAFSIVKLECDTNASAGRGLSRTSVDTQSIIIPGRTGPEEASEHIYVDDKTCRLTFKIENLGAPGEHFSLVIILFFSFVFGVMAVCPAGCWERIGQSIPNLDPAVLPATLQGQASPRTVFDVHHKSDLVMRSKHHKARAVGNTPLHTTCLISEDNTFAIDGSW